MTTRRMLSLAVVLAAFAVGWTPRVVPVNDKSLGPASGSAPTLVNTCLITNNVNQLVEFYEDILAIKAKRTGEDYAEFPTGVGVLAIFSESAQEKIHSRLSWSSEEQERGPGISRRERR